MFCDISALIIMQAFRLDGFKNAQCSEF